MAIKKEKIKRNVNFRLVFLICLFVGVGGYLLVSKILISHPQFTIYKTECYNETRPYHEFNIVAKNYSHVGSGKGDRFEIIECGDCNISKATKNIFYGNPVDKCICECEPFCYYNNNTFDVQIRVYENLTEFICEYKEVQREDIENAPVINNSHIIEDLFMLIFLDAKPKDKIYLLDENCECEERCIGNECENYDGKKYFRGVYRGMLNGCLEYSCGDYIVEVKK